MDQKRMKLDIIEEERRQQLQDEKDRKLEMMREAD